MEGKKLMGFTLNQIRHALSCAYSEAENSTCLKKKVGAAMVSKQSGKLLSVGHGDPATPCKECTRKTREWTQDGCWSIHAELATMFNYFDMAGYTHPLKDCVMVVTHGPCDQCLKYMSYFGIDVVIYDQDYKTDYSKWENKIRVYKLKDLEAIFDGQSINTIQL